MIKMNLIYILLLPLFGLGQEPISWNNTVIRTNATTYEIRMTAIIQLPWHIFSLQQPEDAIPKPTLIIFKKNPLVKMVGTTKEIGKRKTHTDAILGLRDYRYEGTVTFVQSIQVKANVKTNLLFSITYQACTDTQCLLPKIVSFQIPIQ